MRPARSLGDLRGQTFAFTDPHSNTGRMVPTYTLARMGETPEGFFGEALNLIVSKATTLSEMVDELLDLSRVEAGRTITVDPVSTDIRPVLVAALDNFRTGHASHQLVAELPDGPIRLHADPERLMQVLDNLLSNAVKYSAREPHRFAGGLR